jgi:hypothetical protein
MRRKYPQMYERADGWCDWITPIHDGYRMMCCDCGLVHALQFKIVRQTSKEDALGYWKSEKPKQRGLRVVFRAQRDKRATAARRRRKAK